MESDDICVGMQLARQKLLELGFYHLQDYPIGKSWTNKHIWIIWDPVSRKIISIHNGGY